MFYLRPESTNDSNFSGLAFAPGGLRGQHIVAELKTDSLAGFAEATYSITQTTKLTGGIRYTEDSREFDGGQAIVTLAGVEGPLTKNPNTKLDYDAWTYRIALQQIISEDMNVYASFNRGFKSGSYSLQSPLNAPYLPQYIEAYEIGFKSELFDRRLRLNLAGFHYDIEDYQVRSAAVANPGASLILNAATVKVDGAELEFEVSTDRRSSRIRRCHLPRLAFRRVWRPERGVPGADRLSEPSNLPGELARHSEPWRSHARRAHGWLHYVLR